MANYTPVRMAHFIAEPENVADSTLSPLIFLHGMTAVKESWGKIPQDVANKTTRKAYVLDQRDHGDTEWTDAFNFDVLVDDLVHFMDSNSIQKAIIVGHSMGGIVGINTALRRPDKVDALIVADMFVRKMPQPMIDMLTRYVIFSQELIQQIPSHFNLEQALQQFLKEITKFMGGLGTEQKSPENVDLLNEFIKRDTNGRWTFKSNFKAIEGALKDPDSLMSEPEGIYDGPACFIYGTLSTFPVKSDEDHIKSHFPRAEFIALEGASHNITSDCPEKTTEAFLKFISSL